MPTNYDSLPSNSKTVEKEPTAKKVEKVVKSKPILKKKTFGDKLKDAFFSDAEGSIPNYVVFDILVPAVKSTISEMVKKSVDMLLYGDNKPASVRRDGSSSYTSYSNYYQRPQGMGAGQQSYKQRSGRGFSQVIFLSREDAENVLDSLAEQIAQYHVVSLADFYTFADQSSEYTDQAYGWTSVANMWVTQVRDGYIIEMPNPIHL